jgi:hypothetical protein
MLGTARQRRFLTSQLLLGVVLLAFNASIPLESGLQGARKGLPPRRARRLATRIPPRAIRQINVGAECTVTADCDNDDSFSPPGLPVAFLPLPSRLTLDAAGSVACDPDLALHIAFPPRYLVYCSFLC